LSIEGLTVHVRDQSGGLPLVRNATLSVESGRWLGLVGESGAGKSILALSILRLLPPAASVTSGSVCWQGRDLLKLCDRKMQEIRGREISVVFQNALTALNPLFTAGDQVADVYHFHHGGSRREAQQKAVVLFGELGLSDPERTARMYPHQLSGGMAQRVMIAMALIGSPRLLVADDPTSTLDPTIQAQVLDLLSGRVRQRKMSMLLISRDIRLVRALCSEMAVMQGGEIIESGPVDDILSGPTHAYTRQLLEDAELMGREPFDHV
jgi:ABC-type glutathione transport system ATPase component